MYYSATYHSATCSLAAARQQAEAPAQRVWQERAAVTALCNSTRCTCQHLPLASCRQASPSPTGSPSWQTARWSRCLPQRRTQKSGRRRCAWTGCSWLRCSVVWECISTVLVSIQHSWACAGLGCGSDSSWLLPAHHAKHHQPGVGAASCRALSSPSGMNGTDPTSSMLLPSISG